MGGIENDLQPLGILYHVCLHGWQIFPHSMVENLSEAVSRRSF
jgi:hypothetical protein